MGPMPFDQSTRNRLARFVGEARALLSEEFNRQLQHVYGLDPTSGEVTPIERLTALDDAHRETAHILRETLDYYMASASAKEKEALDRIVREQAFTVLNRLCALRMAEARGLLLESIAKGPQSQGFQLYARLAGPALGETGEAYRSYLFSLFDEVAVDLPTLFGRYAPEGRLFPRSTALNALLVLLNDPDLESLWTEDETIGWIYQYFNSNEERQAMRQSRAPQNSRELAVRNQFFTPRYVVEFLTDNTLGRIWYEMTKGETSLIDNCRYLVRRKHPFFLAEGEEPPQPFDPSRTPLSNPDLPGDMWVRPNPELEDIDAIFHYALTVGGYDYAKAHLGIECGELANQKQVHFKELGKWEGTFEELRCCLFFEQRRYHHFGYSPQGEDETAIIELYKTIGERWDYEVEHIPHRSLKDPREIKMLDPACGSMHFGLYAFDLFEQIYAEAWDLEARLGSSALQRLADLDPLHDTYPDREAFLRDVPRLIIERNIHGIDIDPRAVQISGLSLWLRAQKRWQGLGLKPNERPQIRKSNIVCAEPMPGDLQMLEDFLATLTGERLEKLVRQVWHLPEERSVRVTPQMTAALTKLVRTVWQEMELAGEAGSLLTIEETLRETIKTARKEAEEKTPLFQVLEFGLDEPTKEHDHVMASDKKMDFFDTTEDLVLASLQEYAGQTESDIGYRRRLFAGDASQGFAFIEVLRNRFDVILMNPPFGAPSHRSKKYIETRFSRSKGDILANFIERMLHLCKRDGLVGAITNRTCFYLVSQATFREEVLQHDGFIALMADLGSGVLEAMVETAAYTLSPRQPLENKALVIRCLMHTNKDAIIQGSIDSLKNIPADNLFTINPQEFARLSGSPYCYWVSSLIIRKIAHFPRLEGNYGAVRVGLQTGDDERFLRAFWEVPAILIGGAFKKDASQDEIRKKFVNGKCWAFYSKTDQAYPWFSPISMVVNWQNDGLVLKEFFRSNGISPSRYIRSEDRYFKPGFSYMGRSIRIVPFIVPKGVIPMAVRSQVYTEIETRYKLLGYCASVIASSICRFRGGSFGGPMFQASIIQNLPVPNLDKIHEEIIGLIDTEYNLRRNIIAQYEPNQEFCLPGLLLSIDSESGNWSRLSLLGPDIELGIAKAMDLTENQLDEISRDLRESLEMQYSTMDLESEGNDYSDTDENEEALATVSFIEDTPRTSSEELLSYLVGASLGLWDIRMGLDSALLPLLQSAFDPLPVCPLGSLVGVEGLPASPGKIVSEAWLHARPDAITLPDVVDGQVLGQDGQRYPAIVSDDKYPLKIAWNGILVDDPGHYFDIVMRARAALRLLWCEQAEVIEQETCQVLGISELRDYYRKPSGFFADHLKRYSKNRRQAPIYWPLSTPSCSYTLWLYYHRLSDQTLFTCVNDFVDPKLQQVGEDAARLRQKKGRSSAEEKELERLVDFEHELQDLRAELLRVAAFWKPNLNDGVQITAAPLWRLFQHKPWQKKLKETWQKLEAGEYDWAHLAYSIWPERVREKCKSDKSLAIAHDLERLFIEPIGKKKSKRKKKTKEDLPDNMFE
jgi:hypothetical protein